MDRPKRKRNTPGGRGVMPVGALVTIHAVTSATQDGNRFTLRGACSAWQEWEITAEGAWLVEESVTLFYPADRRRIQGWADLTSLRMRTANAAM